MADCHECRQENEQIVCQICFVTEPVAALKPNPCKQCGTKKKIQYHAECLNSAVSMGKPICPLCRANLEVTEEPVTKRDVLLIIGSTLKIFWKPGRWSLAAVMIAYLGALLILVISILTGNIICDILLLVTTSISTGAAILFFLQGNGASTERITLILYQIIQVVLGAVYIITRHYPTLEKNLYIIFLLGAVILLLLYSLKVNYYSVLDAYSKTRRTVFK